jgi:hypothetical protein
MIQEELESHLSSVLTRRLADGQPTIIRLDGSATMYRPSGSFPGLGYHVSLDALHGPQAPWRAVGRFSRMLEPWVANRAAVAGGDGWGEAILPYLTLFACRWAARLARQMHAELACSVAPAGAEVDFRQAYLDCLEDASKASAATRKILEALMRSVKRPLRWLGKPDPPAMLQLEQEAGTVQVRWLARGGKELGQETLHELASRMSRDPQVAALVEETKDVDRRRSGHRDRADRMLEAVCPQLADAVSRARTSDRYVGCRMCSHKVRGLPAEVYVFVGGGSSPLSSVSANLVARRAHEEFVLENRHGQLFYFPPIQLMATIEFLPSDPPWHVPVPMVRMPAGQSEWMHPYTGGLHPDRFAAAELISPTPEKAMVTVSADARRILPYLGQGTARTPMTGCMCLGGQESQTGELARQVHLAEKSGKEPDLFQLIWGLWNVIRVGLTRAHQDNTNSPVAELGTAQMPYPLPSAAALTGTKLAGRVFPYHRR